jgi:hypothetical protein
MKYLTDLQHLNRLCFNMARVQCRMLMLRCGVKQLCN